MYAIAAINISFVVYSRIMTVTSADEFYSIMGVLTREMLEFTDTNHLVKVRKKLIYKYYFDVITLFQIGQSETYYFCSLFSRLL